MSVRVAVRYDDYGAHVEVDGRRITRERLTHADAGDIERWCAGDNTSTKYMSREVKDVLRRICECVADK